MIALYKKRPTLVRWSCDEKRGGICWYRSTAFFLRWPNNLKENAHLRQIFTSLYVFPYFSTRFV